MVEQTQAFCVRLTWPAKLPTPHTMGQTQANPMHFYTVHTIGKHVYWLPADVPTFQGTSGEWTCIKDGVDAWSSLEQGAIYIMWTNSKAMDYNVSEEIKSLLLSFYDLGLLQIAFPNTVKEAQYLQWAVNLTLRQWKWCCDLRLNAKSRYLM